MKVFWRPLSRVLFPRVVYALLFLFLALPSVPAQSGEVVDRIVAVVNDDIILLSELELQAAPFVTRATAGVANEAAKAQARVEVRKQVLDQMVGDALVDQEARLLGIVVAKREVDDEIARIKSTNGLSDEAFFAQLQRQGLTLTRFRKELASQRKRMRLVEIRVKPRVSVTDDVVRDHYNKNFQSDDEVRVRMISYKVPPAATTQEAQKIVDEASADRASILAGKEFVAVAKEKSAGPNAAGGGDLGWFRRGEMNAALEDVAFSLSVGQISSPVSFGGTVYLVQATERRKKPAQDFEKIKGRLHAMLFNRAAEAEYGRWVEELRERGFVDLRLDGPLAKSK